MGVCLLQKTGTNLSNNYGQNLLHGAKKSTADAIKLLQKEWFKKQQKQLVS